MNQESRWQHLENTCSKPLPAKPESADSGAKRSDNADDETFQHSRKRFTSANEQFRIYNIWLSMVGSSCSIVFDRWYRKYEDLFVYSESALYVV